MTGNLVAQRLLDPEVIGEDEREVDAMMANLRTALLLFLQTPGPTRGPTEE